MKSIFYKLYAMFPTVTYIANNTATYNQPKNKDKTWDGFETMEIGLWMIVIVERRFNKIKLNKCNDNMIPNGNSRDSNG